MARQFPPEWYAHQAQRRKNVKKALGKSSSKILKPVRAIGISDRGKGEIDVNISRQGKGKYKRGYSYGSVYSTTGKKKISGYSVERLKRVLGEKLKSDKVRGGRTSLSGIRTSEGIRKVVQRNYVTKVAKVPFNSKRGPTLRIGHFDK